MKNPEQLCRHHKLNLLNITCISGWPRAGFMHINMFPIEIHSHLVKGHPYYVGKHVSPSYSNEVCTMSTPSRAPNQTITFIRHTPSLLQTHPSATLPRAARFCLFLLFCRFLTFPVVHICLRPAGPFVELFNKRHRGPISIYIYMMPEALARKKRAAFQGEGMSQG